MKTLEEIEVMNFNEVCGELDTAKKEFRAQALYICQLVTRLYDLGAIDEDNKNRWIEDIWDATVID